MLQLLTLVEESQPTWDVKLSLPKISVQPMVLLVLPFKPVPHIQLKLDVLKEQTEFVSLLYQLDR